MAFFDDLWDRLQGTERDIYQDLAERYWGVSGNAAAVTHAEASAAYDAISSLTIDEITGSGDWSRDYILTADDIQPVTITMETHNGNSQYINTGYVNSIRYNGEAIYHSTAGWDANWTGYKEQELDDVSEKELISIIGLEGGDV